jgi:hypothetical protein
MNITLVLLVTVVLVGYLPVLLTHQEVSDTERAQDPPERDPRALARQCSYPFHVLYKHVYSSNRIS